MPDGERRLTAIMFTDMAGYTALTQSDEALAMEVLERHNRLLRPFFPRFHGREVKAIGDSFLVEFESALDALRCAAGIQSYLHDYNVSSGDEWKIKLRIGIHLGDVIHKANDVFGDAVNIASRIEPIAEPEGICISEQVYDQVHNKLDIPLVSLGEKSLKNVGTPVEVYAAQMPWDQAVMPRGKTPLLRDRIAILPFANFSPDPNDEYFADSITDEIISTVSGIRGLSVISRTSVMGYKNTTKKVKEIGRELEVGSILEGSFKKAGNKIRVTCQLIDVAGDKHLWAQNYDRELDDVFAVQSDIAQKVAESMKVRLLEAEKVKIEKVPTRSMSAYESYLQGIYLFNKGSLRSVKDSIGHLENAIEQDPDFSQAYAALGNIYVALAGDSMPYREAFGKAEPLIARALQLDKNSSEAHLAAGNLAMQYQLDWQLAETELSRAIELNPNNAAAYSWRSVFYCLTGDLDKGLKDATRAHELDPLSQVVQHGVSRCLVARRQYKDAIALWQRMVELEPDSAHPRIHLTELYRLEGEVDEAKKEIEMARRMKMDSQERIMLVPIYSLLGNREEARRSLGEVETDRQTEYTSLTRLAAAYVALGEKEKAMGLLEASLREERTSFLFSYQDPIFDSVREDPRFASLVARLNLPKRN